MIHEVEQSTIGGLMLDNSRFHDLSLKPEDFQEPVHQHIYQAIQAIIDAGSVADPVTVAEWMDRNYNDQYGSFSYIGGLANNTPSAARVHAYAKLVQDNSRRRRALGILQEGLENLEERGNEVIDETIAELMQLVDGDKRYESNIQGAVTEAINRLEWMENHPGLIGLPTGLIDLDTFLGGFQPADLYVIGARPAMGKTALMLNMALAADKPIGMFSAEQPMVQIGQRILAITGGASTTNMRRAEMTQEDWNAVTETLKNIQNKTIVINDKSAPTITDVVRQTRKWKREHDIKGIYLDYIQRMRGPNAMKRHEQVEEIVRGLKELAKELDIAVIALAQVNRDVEKRSDKRPHMGDLRDSGAIEQEADNVMMLYRDEVYNEDTRYQGVAEINVEKNRHGRTGYIRTEWKADQMIFTNMRPTDEEGV